jgi:hypothetical protein
MGIMINLKLHNTISITMRFRLSGAVRSVTDRPNCYHNQFSCKIQLRLSRQKLLPNNDLELDLARWEYASLTLSSSTRSDSAQYQVHWSSCTLPGHGLHFNWSVANSRKRRLDLCGNGYIRAWEFFVIDIIQPGAQFCPMGRFPFSGSSNFTIEFHFARLVRITNIWLIQKAQ